MKRLLQGGWLLVLLGCAAQQEQLPAGAKSAAQQSACGGPEYRQLDFWLGSWDVSWGASPGQPAGRGTNVITRDFEGCVVHEHFGGGPTTGDLIGESWSTYHAPTQRWRQTWVDNQGGYFALVGGPKDDKFVLVSSSISDNTPQQRMMFEEITPNSFTWRWQRTADHGVTWMDSWMIRYVRRTPH